MSSNNNNTNSANRNISKGPGSNGGGTAADGQGNAGTQGQTGESGNNNRFRKRRQNQHQDKGKLKFKGLNKEELEGIVICDSIKTPLAQQYDALYEALLVHAGGRKGSGGKAKKSILSFTHMKKEEFDPEYPDDEQFRQGKDNAINEKMRNSYIKAWEKAVEEAYVTHRKYEETMENIYNVIIGQLGRDILSNLKGHADWEDIHTNSKTIDLLKTLRDLCYRDDTSKLDAAIDVVRKMKKAMTAGQHDPNKTTSEFVEETTTKFDVLKASGTIIINKQVIEYTLAYKFEGRYNYKDYCEMWGSTDPATIKIKERIEEAMHKTYLSRIIIEGTNDKTYQSLRLELEKDFAKGHDNYPNTVAGATGLLNKYRVKQVGRRNQDQHQQRGNQDEATVSMNISTEDNKSVSPDLVSEAHLLLMRDIGKDYDDDSDDFSLLQRCTDVDTAQYLPKCYVPEHETVSEEEDMAGLFGMEYYRREDSNHRLRDTVDDRRISETSMENSYQFAQASGGKVDPYWLLLDSQASCNIMCNTNLVTNIREHPEGRTIRVHCNSGSVTLGVVADMAGYGTVWFYEDGIANCLSLARVSDTHRITLDTAVDQAFFLHREDGSTRRFGRTHCNLYASDVRTEKAYMLITTVEGKKINYSDRDVRRAKAARALQNIMMYHSTKELLKMIDNNAIKDCAITRRDLLMSEDIFGVNTDMVKGKTVRCKAAHMREDIVAVPPEVLKNYGNVY